MTTTPRLTYVEAAQQVTQEWLPTGAAGGAWLHPAPDVELIFDRSSGALCRLAIAAGKPGGSGAVSDAAATFLANVFGPAAAPSVARVAASHSSARGLVARPAPLAVLSELACLRTSRLTSPVPAALWRDAEEARLADVAVPGQESVPPLLPGLAATAANCDLAEVTGIEVAWALDPTLVPDGIFVPALSPEDDVMVRLRAGGRTLVVEAQLAAGAARGDLGQCRARLVLPVGRRLITEGSFSWPGPRVTAELELPGPVAELAGAWIEIVGDELMPVRGSELRYIRRALRWGDAAVRAEQRPDGLAPGFSEADWTAFAAVAWRRCWQDWSKAGDADRAYLAARRLASYDPATTVPAAPSEWAARLAGHPTRERPASIAAEDGVS